MEPNLFLIIYKRTRKGEFELYNMPPFPITPNSDLAKPSDGQISIQLMEAVLGDLSLDNRLKNWYVLKHLDIWNRDG